MSGKTLLVVDDEAIVLSVSKRILESAGYRVLCAADGAQALEACRDKGNLIDAVLTDINMPRVNGPALVQCLAQSHPGMPVMFMTGYKQDSPIMQEFLREPHLDGHKVIQKPFTPKELVAAISKLIAEAPGGAH